MPNKRYKVVFAGTPDFAIPGLKALFKDPRFEIKAVITQIDKPIGRKQELVNTPVKKAALELGLKVWQPKNINNISDQINQLEPDFIVVIAYGQILKKVILDIPKIACVNVHASLLPKYRGASCLQAPILNGDKETGISIMLMDEGLDTGDILRQEKIELSGTENLEFLHDNLSVLGASVLADTLDSFAQGKIKPQKQDESLSSYVSTISKKDGQINWNEAAIEIDRKIRAFNPWPGAYGFLDRKIFKVIKTKVAEINRPELKNGQIFTENRELLIKCGQNSLLILELQLEGAKAMDSQSFLAGHQDIIGKIIK